MRTMTKLFGNILTIAVLILMVAAMNTSAATFTVTITNDSGAGSLRQAILNANAAAGDDIIAFDSSFNVPRTITVGGTEMTITGSGGLTINGPGMNLLTVNGNVSSRIFEVSNIVPATLGTVTFNNLTITNGSSAFSGAGTGAGIGINNGSADFPAAFVPVVINNVLFKNNFGFVNPGGGIGCVRSGSITVNNSVFTGNAANNGGAISSGSGIGQCSVTITNSSFYENQINGAGSPQTTISFGGNPGTAIYTISGSSFYNNGNGAGFYTVRMESSATTNTITNTTFSNNRNVGATVLLSLGAWTMTNVTISKNTATSDNVPAGINLGNGSILNMGNSILAGNTSPGGENNISQFDSGGGMGPFVSQGYNIIGNSFQPLVITGNTTGNLLGVNPLLDATVRNNGGATPTLNLRPGSPAIDAGNPTTFPATDQRGITRPQDGDGNGTSRSDIGAFEKRVTDILPPAFDFDGDRKADVSVFRPSNGTWYLLNSQAGFSGLAFGLSTDKLVPADYDGDGRTDIAVVRNGIWYLQRSSLGFTGIVFGDGNDIPVPADYDGDGRADIAVFRPSNGTWYLQRSTLGFTGIAFGQNGDKPVAADYDGDGRADVAVNRNGIWYLNRSQLGFTGIQFGDSNDKLVPADYDGDGKADVAVFRPSNGVWYLLQSTAGFTGIAFGFGTDLPTAADYDGDGKADVAVFRSGTWYLNRTTQGFTGIAFGAATDAPIPNAFVR